MLRELDCAEEEVALETWVDHEGTSGGIHRSHVHSALDFFNRELLSVVPMRVVFVLANESNGTLRIIDVESWHIKIIDEVD